MLKQRSKQTLNLHRSWFLHNRYDHSRVNMANRPSRDKGGGGLELKLTLKTDSSSVGESEGV